MAEVSLYVAAITAAAGIVGATIPQVASFAHDARQAKRDRSERRAGDMRRACLDILNTAGQLRTRVGNAGQVYGGEMAARLAEIRSSAADVQLHAVSVGLLAQARLAEPAQRLADAAARLALGAERSTDRAAQQMVSAPSFTELDNCATAFRDAAIAQARAAAY
jgi:hypothetical protein